MEIIYFLLLLVIEFKYILLGLNEKKYKFFAY